MPFGIDTVSVGGALTDISPETLAKMRRTKRGWLKYKKQFGYVRVEITRSPYGTRFRITGSLSRMVNGNNRDAVSGWEIERGLTELFRRAVMAVPEIGEVDLWKSKLFRIDVSWDTGVPYHASTIQACLDAEYRVQQSQGFIFGGRESNTYYSVDQRTDSYKPRPGCPYRAMCVYGKDMGQELGRKVRVEARFYSDFLRYHFTESRSSTDLVQMITKLRRLALKYIGEQLRYVRPITETWADSHPRTTDFDAYVWFARDLSMRRLLGFRHLTETGRCELLRFFRKHNLGIGDPSTLELTLFADALGAEIHAFSPPYQSERQHKNMMPEVL